MQRRRFLASSLATLAAARLAKSDEPPTDPRGLVDGNNRFAIELYANLKAEKGNVFCSPFSISAALAMTALGARGKTAEQMSSVLHLPATAETHAEFSTLLRQLNAGGEKRSYQLNIANGLWGQTGYGFKADFLAAAKTHYGAGLTELNLAGHSEESRKTINAWIEKETQGKIKDLLARGTINVDTRLVLTNAIYFKGDWAEPFNKQATYNEPFFAGADQKTPAPMMHRTGDYRYFENDQLQMLGLPYKGKELSMLLLLPRKKDGLAGLETAATADAVPKWVAQMRNAQVVVTLPKFKSAAEYHLIPTMKALGMTAPFEHSADFSGMCEKNELFISEIAHKAFVDVNEEGTEAAAATGVVMQRYSSHRVQPVFRADHPFLYMIRDDRNGGILFMGRLANP